MKKTDAPEIRVAIVTFEKAKSVKFGKFQDLLRLKHLVYFNLEILI